jgi:hypothetical protein
MEFREWLGSFAICHLNTHANFKTRKRRARLARFISNAAPTLRLENAGRVATLYPETPTSRAKERGGTLQLDSISASG